MLLDRLLHHTGLFRFRNNLGNSLLRGGRFSFRQEHTLALACERTGNYLCPRHAIKYLSNISDIGSPNINFAGPKRVFASVAPHGNELCRFQILAEESVPNRVRTGTYLYTWPVNLRGVREVPSGSSNVYIISQR